jgi:hypothetical protein
MFQYGNSRKNVRFLSVILISCFISPLFAIIGIGAHYGIDLTLKMDTKLMEQTTFDSLKFSLKGKGITSLPSKFDSLSILKGADIPVFINRKDWQNTGINMGGKIYVDVIPFINALEISGNFGVWQYDGSVIYPKSISVNPNASANSSKLSDLAIVNYDTMVISLKQINPDRFFWGVEKTPYAKLHFDATLRKYLLQTPPILKTFKIYAGLGATLDFATPMLSSGLIEKAVASTLKGTYTLDQMGPAVFSNPDVKRKILNTIIDDMLTPHWGCHLDLGTMIKVPMIPLGFYVDGKYIIRFDKMDKYVDIGGNGLLFNFGIALAF